MRRYKRIYIFGIDGAGVFFRNTPTPNMDRIFKNGSVTYDMTTSEPTISAQCWGSMFHGVIAQKHKLNNRITANTPYHLSRYPSFMKVMRDNIPDTEMISFCSWSNINIGIIEDDIDVYKYNNSNEPELVDKLCEYLDSNDPNVMYIHLDMADAAGHANGYNTPNHLKAITRADELVGKIYDKTVEKGYDQDCMYILTTDHGGTPPNEKGRGSHGGNSIEEKICTLAVAGKTVEKGIMGDVDIRDIASICLYAFDIKQPDTWTSKIPVNLFNDNKGSDTRPEEPFVPDHEFASHINKDTPEHHYENLSSIFGKDFSYYGFDDNTKDGSGKYDFDSKGKIYFPEGYFGKCISLYDGQLNSKYEFGTDSFTISTWIKNEDDEYKFVLTNMGRDSENQQVGIEIGLSGDIAIDFKFHTDNKARMRFSVSTPDNPIGRWYHLLLSFDRINQKAAVYIDFEKISEYDINLPQDKTFDVSDLITNENGGAYSIDELIISKKILTEKEIKNLSEVYR